jgi:hypothetical protein
MYWLVVLPRSPKTQLMTRRGRLATLVASCGGLGQPSIPLILVPTNSPKVHHDAEHLLGPLDKHALIKMLRTLGGQSLP